MTALSPGVHAGVPAVQDAAVTPMHLVQMAVAQNADADKLAKLLDLQLRWEADQARKAYVQAFAEFKKKPLRITKNKDVSHSGKFMYSHATLDNVADIIGAALSEVSITHSWDVEQAEGGKIKVTCVLTHVLGHSTRTPLEASPDTSGAKNSIQAVGSTVTYLQRYSLLAATGVAVSNQDDDGAGGKGGMDEKALADWKAKIDELANKDDGPALWKDIAKACDDAKDVPAFRELQPVYAAKMKALR